MWEVVFFERGPVHDFKRIDHKKFFVARRYFKSGGLYYFYVDNFNVVVIAEEDVISVVEL